MRVYYYSGCGGAYDETVARLNIVPGAVTSMPITVNNLSGTQTFTLCNGSTDLVLRGTPNRAITQYSVTLQKGNMNGSTFTAQGASATTGNINSTSFPDRNLHTVGSGYINGYNGALKITVVATNPCGSYTSEQIITIRRETSMGALTYTMKGVANKPDTAHVLICDNMDPLILAPTISGSVYTYDLEFTKGSWISNTFYPLATPLNVTNIPSASMPLNLAADPTIRSYLTSGAVLGIPGVVMVNVTANGPCTPGTAFKTQVYNFRFEQSNSNLAYKLNNLPNSGSVVDVVKCDNDKVLNLVPSIDGTAPSSFNVSIQKGAPDINGDFSGTYPPEDGDFSSFPLDLADAFDYYLVNNNQLYEGLLKVIVTSNGNCNKPNLTQIYNIQNRTSISSFSYTLKGEANDPDPVDVWLCGNDNSLSLAPAVTGNVTSYTILAQIGEFTMGGYFGNKGPSEQKTVPATPMPVDLSVLFDSYLLDGNGDLTIEGLKLTITANGPCNAPVKEQIYKFHRGDHATNLIYTLNGEPQSANPVDIWLCAGAQVLSLNPSASGTVTGYHIKVERGRIDINTGVFTSDGTSDENSFTSTPVDLVDKFPTYLNNGSLYEGPLKVTVTTEGPCNDVSGVQIYRIRKGQHNTTLTYTLNQRANESDSIKIWMCENADELMLNPSQNGTALSYLIRLQKGNFNSNGDFSAAGLHEEKTVANTGNAIDLGSEFSTYLNAGLYAGGLEVTVTTAGPCNDVDKVQTYDIIRASDNTNLAFSLNDQDNDTDPVLIALCDGSEVLTLEPDPDGTALKYTVQVIKGGFNPITGDFEPENPTGASLDLDASEFPANLVAKFPSYLRSGGVLFSNDGLYVKLTTHGPCQNTDKEQVYRIKRGTSTSNLSYTLNAQANDAGSVAIWLCNGADELNLNPSANGSVDSYFVKVEKGTYTGGSFNDDGTADSVKVHTSATPVELYATFASYLNAGSVLYEGGLRVTVATKGLCNSLVLVQIYQIHHADAIAGLDFTVNNAFQNTALSPAPEVWMCNDTSLILRASSNGTSEGSISITLQKGTFDVVNGFDGGFTSSITRVVPYTNSIELYDIPDFKTYLGGNPGIVQVTVSAAGPCNVTPVSKAQVFDIRSANAAISYVMSSPQNEMGDYVCFMPEHGWGYKSKHKIPVFDSLGVIQTYDPPCVSGWLGAYDLGIAEGEPDFVNTNAISKYLIVVDEFAFANDSINKFPLDSIKRVINREVNVLPNGRYSFNNVSIPRDYFRNNYETISNKYMYRLMISVNTNNCGLIVDTSYFMILKGLSDNGAGYWKPADVERINSMDSKISIYPNPTEDKLFIEFSEGIADDTDVTILNSLGQIVIKQKLDKDKNVVSVGGIASGIYHYIVSYKGNVIKGHFIKK